jgi:transcriptional regulator with XRE-family HTH domain
VPRRATPDAAALVIGQRIRELREEADLGLEELAHAADFSKGHLSNLERGYVMPTVATLRGLADALGVLVADLVIDPEGSDREKVINLTRSVPKGTLKRLAKDLGALKKIKTS